MSLGQAFALNNNANPGSPDANVALMLTGAGAAAYSLTQPTVGSLAAGSSVTETVTFAAATAVTASASVSLTAVDPLCIALPAPLVLTGTGTAGSVSVSATSFAFGRPGDPDGLVNCGAIGNPQTLTVSNVGNQAFQVVSATFGKGASSPFTLSGATTVAVGIGGSLTLTISPTPIPATANPNDPSAFSDTLTIATDAAGDEPHTVALTMQPRGAVIADTPLPTAWSFGTVGPGSIGTFTTSISNTGNAPATVALQGLSTRGIFGLQGNPTTVPAAAVTALVGQFAPPSANGNWTDSGDLTVTAPDAFCAPLPSSWVSPTLEFSGSSNANAVVTLSGGLVFPTTDCSSAPPAGQSVTLANLTNRALTYAVKFASGAWYTFADSGSGSLAANGVASIVVNPKTISPGPGVVPGSAPYADDLIIAIATSPATTTFTAPISWTLNGAVLSLPQGSGPDSDGTSPFYVADSTSGFPLPMANGGTASATVNLAIQPPGSFSLAPAPALQVLPNIPSLNELVSGGTGPACPATSPAAATFGYAGPVCQPFPLSAVRVRTCTGTFVAGSGAGGM